MKVKSEFGKGTKFSFIIHSFKNYEVVNSIEGESLFREPETPISDCSSKELQVPLFIAFKHKKCKCPQILVVDDMELIRFGLKTVFESHNLLIAEACDGEDAVH